MHRFPSPLSVITLNSRQRTSWKDFHRQAPAFTPAGMSFFAEPACSGIQDELANWAGKTARVVHALMYMLLHLEVRQPGPLEPQ